MLCQLMIRLLVVSFEKVSVKYRLKSHRRSFIGYTTITENDKRYVADTQTDER